MNARRGILVAAMALWVVAQLVWLRPDTIAGSWRECDTQAMARYYATGPFDLLRPRIDWGGTGPGYVESEFPLYSAVIGLGMRVVGEAEWLGQLISLLAILVAAGAVFDVARRLFDPSFAFLAPAVLLTSRLGVSLSISVMPDALCLAFYALGLRSLVLFESRRRTADLVAMAAFTALAGLVKPTALQLGIAQALFVLLCARDELRRPRIYVAWVLTLVPVVAYLLHAQQLYREYGNTFGVLSGGDTKFPTLRHLLMPGLHKDLVLASLGYGIGVLGALSAVFLLARRKLHPLELSLGIGNLVGLYVSFRYSVTPEAGAHYHVFTVLLAALLVGHAACELVRVLRPAASRAVVPAVCAMMLAQYAFSVFSFRSEHEDMARSPAMHMGRSLAALDRPGTIIVVRSPKPRNDPFWHQETNYQEPLVMYSARMRGFIVPADASGAEPVAALASEGARYYVEPGPPRGDAELEAWLAEHAELVESGESGRIYRFVTPPDEPRRSS